MQKNSFIDSEKDSKLVLIDFFDVVALLSANNMGREIIWDYIRQFYYEVIEDYGIEDYRLGKILVDISYSFETEYLFYEVKL